MLANILSYETIGVLLIQYDPSYLSISYLSHQVDYTIGRYPGAKHVTIDLYIRRVSTLKLIAMLPYFKPTYYFTRNTFRRSNPAVGVTIHRF